MHTEHFLCFTLLSALLVLQHFPQLIIAGSPVELLPGFQGPLPFQLETGYIGVGESEDVQLYYYLIKSESKPESDPVILWLTGGPGCSALSGLIYEIGPITFEAVENDGSQLPKLVLRTHSWTKAASIIFLDFPVGTGFSYATTPAALQSVDVQACYQVYEFLRKWLVDYQEFNSNPFYVGGDSYSGLIVPFITQLIDNGNELGSRPHINIKGYLLGNPATSPDSGNYKVTFARGMGLISDELFESLKRSCEGSYFDVDPSNKECLQYLDAFNQLLAGINYPHILEPLCGFASPRFGLRRSLDEKSQDLTNVGEFSALTCRIDWYKLIYQWANDDNVRHALHVQKGTTEQWMRCNYGVQYTTTIGDSIPYHVNLSVKGFRSLIYSGDHDYIIPFESTQAWIRSLNYSIIDDWRRWIVEGQIAGYTRTYSNQMTFATVKGGGHTAPEYKPVECLAMLKRWLSHEPL